jgi:hypothetical protein
MPIRSLNLPPGHFTELLEGVGKRCLFLRRALGEAVITFEMFQSKTLSPVTVGGAHTLKLV